MKSLQVLQTLGAGRADSSARRAPGAAVEQSLALGKEGEALKPRRQSLWNRETAVAACRHSGLKRRQAETD